MSKRGSRSDSRTEDSRTHAEIVPFLEKMGVDDACRALAEAGAAFATPVSRRGFMALVGASVLAQLGIGSRVVEAVGGDSLLVSAWADEAGESPTWTIDVIKRWEVPVAFYDVSDPADPVPVVGASVTLTSFYGDGTVLTGITGSNGAYVFDVKNCSEPPDEGDPTGIQKNVYRFWGSVIAEMRGFRVYETLKVRVQGGDVIYAATEPLDGMPYLRCVGFDGNDIQYAESATFMTAKGNDIEHELVVKVAACGGSAVEVGFAQGSVSAHMQVKPGSDDIAVASFKGLYLCSDPSKSSEAFVPGELLTISVTPAASNPAAFTMVAAMSVEEGKTDTVESKEEDYFNLTQLGIGPASSKVSISSAVRFPDEIPLLGGKEIYTWIPGIPFHIMINPFGWIYIGFRWNESLWKSEYKSIDTYAWARSTAEMARKAVEEGMAAAFPGLREGPAALRDGAGGFAAASGFSAASGADAWAGSSTGLVLSRDAKGLAVPNSLANGRIPGRVSDVSTLGAASSGFGCHQFMRGLGLNFEFGIAAYFLWTDENKDMKVEGPWEGLLQSWITLSVDAQMTYRFMVSVVPVYLGLGFRLAASLQVEAGIATKGRGVDEMMDNLYFDAETVFGIDTSIGISVSAGVGVPNGISLGVRGFGYMGAYFGFGEHPTKPMPRVVISGGLTAYWNAQILMVNFSGVICGKSWPAIYDTWTQAGNATGDIFDAANMAGDTAYDSAHPFLQQGAGTTDGAVNLADVSQRILLGDFDSARVLGEADIRGIAELRATAVGDQTAGGNGEGSDSEFIPPDSYAYAYIERTGISGFSDVSDVGVLKAGRGQQLVKAMGIDGPEVWESWVYARTYSDPRMKLVTIQQQTYLLRILPVDYGAAGVRTRLTWARYNAETGKWGTPMPIDGKFAGEGDTAHPADVARWKTYDYDFDIARYTLNNIDYLWISLVCGTREGIDAGSSLSDIGDQTYWAVIRMDCVYKGTDFTETAAYVRKPEESDRNGVSAAAMYSLPRILAAEEFGNHGISVVAFVNMTTSAKGNLFGDGRREHLNITVFNGNHRPIAFSSTSNHNRLHAVPWRTGDRMDTEHFKQDHSFAMRAVQTKDPGETTAKTVISIDRAYLAHDVSQGGFLGSAAYELDLIGSGWHNSSTPVCASTSGTTVLKQTKHPTSEASSVHGIATSAAIDGIIVSCDNKLKLVDAEAGSLVDIALHEQINLDRFALSLEGDMLYFATIAEGTEPDRIVDIDGTTTSGQPVHDYRIWVSPLVKASDDSYKFLEPFCMGKVQDAPDMITQAVVYGSATAADSDTYDGFMYSSIVSMADCTADIRFCLIPRIINIDVLGFHSEELYVCAGEEEWFKVSVRNNGNVIVSAFDIIASNGKDEYRIPVYLPAQANGAQSAGVSCAQPLRNARDVDAKALRAALDASGASAESFRGFKDVTSFTDVPPEASVMMPGWERSYRLRWKVPEEWHGKVELTVRVDPDSVRYDIDSNSPGVVREFGLRGQSAVNAMRPYGSAANGGLGLGLGEPPSVSSRLSIASSGEGVSVRHNPYYRDGQEPGGSSDDGSPGKEGAAIAASGDNAGTLATAAAVVAAGAGAAALALHDKGDKGAGDKGAGHLSQ